MFQKNSRFSILIEDIQPIKNKKDKEVNLKVNSENNIFKKNCFEN